METLVVTCQISGAGSKACRKPEAEQMTGFNPRARAAPAAKPNGFRLMSTADQQVLENFFPAAARTLRGILGR